MSKAYEAVLDEFEQVDLLTTGDVAKLLGVSPQHVVNLCNRGDLPYVMRGTHRRIRRADVERYRVSRTRMTRDQRRSLWLAHAVAGRLVADTDAVIRQARLDLDKLEELQRANKWTREWRRLLSGPVDEVLIALTSPSQRSRELRQNSPFVSTLSVAARDDVLEEFRRDEAGDEAS